VLKLLRTGKDGLLETAMRLHDVAMKDEYFIKRCVE
jgi:citrate synthase